MALTTSIARAILSHYGIPMTIITLESGISDLELADQLLSYQCKLAGLRLPLHCIGGDDYRIHLEIPTRNAQEHEVAIQFAKAIFQVSVII